MLLWFALRAADCQTLAGILRRWGWPSLLADLRFRPRALYWPKRRLPTVRRGPHRRGSAFVSSYSRPKLLVFWSGPASHWSQRLRRKAWLGPEACPTPLSCRVGWLPLVFLESLSAFFPQPPEREPRPARPPAQSNYRYRGRDGLRARRLSLSAPATVALSPADLNPRSRTARPLPDLQVLLVSIRINTCSRKLVNQETENFLGVFPPLHAGRPPRVGPRTAYVLRPRTEVYSRACTDQVSCGGGAVRNGRSDAKSGAGGRGGEGSPGGEIAAEIDTIQEIRYFLYLHWSGIRKPQNQNVPRDSALDPPRDTARFTASRQWQNV